DIIIALTGGTIGELGIVQGGLGKLYLNQRVGKFDILNPNEFEKEYIYWIARGVEGIVKNLAWGAAIPNVSPKQIEELNFPIPSKDIQKNIIRFLNDLRNGNVTDDIYFDEEIENEIKDIQEKQVKLGKVQDELSHQLTQLENLNQAILQEAVQGKLVKQDPKDEPASELLKRIKAEKATLRQAQGKGKKEKPLPPIKPEEIPFEIPENWVWCRLGEICVINGGYAFKSTDYLSEGYRVIRISDFDPYGFIDNSIVRHSYNDKLNSFLLDKEDILLAMTGGTVGKSLYVESIPEPMLVNQRVATIKTTNSFLAPKYIDTVIKSWITQKVIHERKNSTNDNISMDDIKGFLIPLPPLSEQKRIVAEIEKQFTKTKQLKEHIIANQQATEQLLKALLHQAFEVKEMEII